MIYLDNAATTPVDEEVIQLMSNTLRECYGNPSSTHSFGRKSKSLLEAARKSVAQLLNVSASEIIFTSSGTEADNLILFNAVYNLGVKRIITSKIEHHAVLHPIEFLAKKNEVKVDYVCLNKKGEINLSQLENLLENSSDKTLVSLMHINNEIGNILPLDVVANLCKKYDAYFHSDTVQTIGHYSLDLNTIPIDFIVGSAHKFHGPKGVGFAYFKKGLGIKPMIYGGNQEKGARSSTENLHSIVGMQKALELAYRDLESDKKYTQDLKTYCIKSLLALNSEITFNGNSGNLSKSSYTILNVQLPKSLPMLLFQMDLSGIAVSGGSACQSGSNAGSHVLNEIKNEPTKETSLRISFSKKNTKEDIDILIKKIKELF